MRPTLILLSLSLVVGVSTMACKRMSTGAKEDFARRHSCPEDRVSVKERTDVSAASLLAPGGNESPPDDVKRDPGRLAKWEADKKEQRAKTESGYARSYTVYEVRGCNVAVFLACTNADSTNGEMSLVCQEKPLEPVKP